MNLDNSKRVHFLSMISLELTENFFFFFLSIFKKIIYKNILPIFMKFNKMN